MLRRMRRPSAKLLLLVPPLLFGLAYLERLESGATGDWRAASRAPVGLAPDPATTPEPVIQVYAARAVRWRGYFGVHTWIAVKPRAAPRYTVYEVNGWRLRRTGSCGEQERSSAGLALVRQHAGVARGTPRRRSSTR